MVSRYKIYPQGLTYLVACLARRINSKTGEKEIIDRHKIGLTKKQSFDGRMRQYDDTTEEINYREGNYEKFFLGYNSLFEKKYPGRDEFFIRTSIEIEEAYRSFIFFDETIERLDNIFFKEFLKILDNTNPKIIVDEIKINLSKYPNNISSWDENRCIDILTKIFTETKYKNFRLLPGQYMRCPQFISSYEQEYLDTRKTKVINLNFGGSYPTRTIKFDLYGLLCDKVFKAEKEGNLGKNGEGSADIIGPNDMNPNFNAGVQLATGGLGKSIYDIVGYYSYYNQRRRDPNLNPLSSLYLPVILDKNKIVGLDGLSIVTYEVASKHIMDIIKEVINNLPDTIK